MILTEYLIHSSKARLWVCHRQSSCCSACCGVRSKQHLWLAQLSFLHLRDVSIQKNGILLVWMHSSSSLWSLCANFFFSFPSWFPQLPSSPALESQRLHLPEGLQAIRQLQDLVGAWVAGWRFHLPFASTDTFFGAKCSRITKKFRHVSTDRSCKQNAYEPTHTGHI